MSSITERGTIEIPGAGSYKLSQQGLIMPHGYEKEVADGHLNERFSKHLAAEMERTGYNGPIANQFVAHPELENRFYGENGKLREGLNSDPLLETANTVLAVYAEGQTYVGKPKELPFSEEQLAQLREENKVQSIGLIYKYEGGVFEGIRREGRALWELLLNCNSNCRHCFREDMGTQGRLPDELIDLGLEYMRRTPGLREALGSGGDFLTLSERLFAYPMDGLIRLKNEGHISRVRMGTRLPFHDPDRVQDFHYRYIEQLEPFIMLHINHYEELQHPKTREVYRNMRKAGGRLNSQSVFLRGVNAVLKQGYGLGDVEYVTEEWGSHDGERYTTVVADNSIDEKKTVQTLIDTFVAISDAGIEPYYVFQNDPVPWAWFYSVPLPQAMRIWGHVRGNMSGVVAKPRLVIDAPEGWGKIAVPEGNAWGVDLAKGFYDFKKIHHDIRWPFPINVKD